MKPINNLADGLVSGEIHCLPRRIEHSINFIIIDDFVDNAKKMIKPTPKNKPYYLRFAKKARR